MKDKSIFQYETITSAVEYKAPLRFRIKAWLKSNRPEVRTLRSEHFTLRLDKWWRPSERKAGRLTLKTMERLREEHRKDMDRLMGDALLYGTAFAERKWAERKEKRDT